MLILTRHEGQTIHISDNITIQVIRIGDTQVRIGAEAPVDIEVLRGELLPLVEAEE